MTSNNHEAVLRELFQRTVRFTRSFDESKLTEDQSGWLEILGEYLDMVADNIPSVKEGLDV